MKKIGFIINPIAGMGGKVGLKGTDGLEKEAIKRGAKPIAEERAKEFLTALKKMHVIYTCASKMGENACKETKKDAVIVYQPAEKTTAMDTKKAAKKMLEEEVDILVFVGGDGTACDIVDVINARLPVLGVPSGVKMYSAVFAFTPKDAAEILESDELHLEEREVIDIDEEAFRKGIVKTKLKGYALVPCHEKIQAGKEFYSENGKEEIASWFIEEIDDKAIYIIGGGSTTWEIKKALGIEGSFLGIDVIKIDFIKGHRLLCKDAGEKEIKKFLNGNVKIVVSPLGKQGFIFGRGNQPISAEVIKKVGKENIIVVATKGKLNRIDSLKVDTGDEKVNEMLRGFINVFTGYRERRIMRVE